MSNDENLLRTTDFIYLADKYLGLIDEAFDEVLVQTVTWLNEESTKEFLYGQHYRLSDFFEESGIRNKWDEIIRKRAKMGANLSEEIYEFARSIGRETDLIPYTPKEKVILNHLCDNNYELIKGVTEDQITGIRRQLIQDYAEGLHPSTTTIKKHLDEIKLQPINGLSPEKRAEMIARTETRRAMNIGTLQTFKEQGVEFVQPLCSPDCCSECEAHSEEVYHIDDALDEPNFHPNCNCGWKPVRNPETGYYLSV